MKFELVTKYNDEEIRHDMTDDIVKMATTQIMMLKDKHTRQALIELGWTPPGEPCERCREIVEIYAGMEDFVPRTAPEEYLRTIVRRMYDCARGANKKKGGGCK